VAPEKRLVVPAYFPPPIDHNQSEHSTEIGGDEAKQFGEALIQAVKGGDADAVNRLIAYRAIELRMMSPFQEAVRQLDVLRMEYLAVFDEGYMSEFTDFTATSQYREWVGRAKEPGLDFKQSGLPPQVHPPH